MYGDNKMIIDLVQILVLLTILLCQGTPQRKLVAILVSMELQNFNNQEIIKCLKNVTQKCLKILWLAAT